MNVEKAEVTSTGERHLYQGCCIEIDLHVLSRDKEIIKIGAVQKEWDNEFGSGQCNDSVVLHNHNEFTFESSNF